MTLMVFFLFYNNYEQTSSVLLKMKSQLWLSLIKKDASWAQFCLKGRSRSRFLWDAQRRKIDFLPTRNLNLIASRGPKFLRESLQRYPYSSASTQHTAAKRQIIIIINNKFNFSFTLTSPHISCLLAFLFLLLHDVLLVTRIEY